MSLFAPFRALRFGPNVPLARAICPPYDIIGPKAAAELRRRPVNAVAVELPGPDGYERAHEAWTRWLREGGLVWDRRPSYTILEQIFTWNGRARRRLGVFGALKLEPPGSKRVLAHERTLSKPKKDRLRLLAALRANTSPIFGAVDDPGRRVAKLLASLSKRKPDHDLRDGDGTRLKVWKVDEPGDVARLERALDSRQVLIADGHHRYLVAWRYSRMSELPGAKRLMVYLCSEEDPGLLVLPTHRVVKADAALRRRIERALARDGRAVDCRSLRELEAKLGRAESLAFGLADGGLKLCRPKGRPPKYGRGAATLDVQWVRRLLAQVDPHDLTYVKDAGEAVRLARKQKGLAFLIKPPSLAGIRDAVRRTGLLPQKSTYFYPKVPTGIVFRELDV